MENMDKPESTPKPKKSKSKSVVRWEALTVFALVVSLAMIYVVFLLEFHLKWIAENTAFESIGTEVNIGSIDIDFSEPSIFIDRIQMTNPDKPEENSIEIGKIKLTFAYAPLLKGSFISDETSVLGIKFHTKRSSPGRVLPKDQRVLILKDPSRAKVHDALRGKFKASAFSDLADLFKKDKRAEIKKQYKEKLASLKVSEEIEKQTKAIKDKAKSIEDGVSSSEVKGLLAEVKNFKFEAGSTKDSLDSAAKALALVEKLKSKRKEIKNEVNSLQSEISSLKQQVKSAPIQFLKDSNMLKASLDPSQMSPNKISEEILSEYFSIQLSQVDRVTSSLKKQALGDKAKYVDPANLPKSSGDSKPTKNQMSLEKEKERIFKKYGKNVVFYKPAVFPKYWFKKIIINSKSSAGQDLGDVSGLITDFSASPELLKNPMVVKINGSVPKQGIGSFTIDSTIDHRKIDDQSEKISIEVTDYLVKGLELFEGSDEWIKIVKSNSSTVLDVFLKNDEINLELKQTLKTPSYEVFAEDKNVESLMKRLQNSGSDLNLSLKASGDIKKPKLKISSNIGDLILSIVKDELKSQASALVSKGLAKLSGAAADKLNPYLKEIDVASLKADDLDKIFDKEIEQGLQKLKQKDQTKDLKDKLMKKLFKKF